MRTAWNHIQIYWSNACALLRTVCCFSYWNLALLGHFPWMYQPVQLQFCSPSLRKSPLPQAPSENISQTLKVAVSLHCEPKSRRQETEEKQEKDNWSTSPNHRKNKALTSSSTMWLIAGTECWENLALAHLAWKALQGRFGWFIRKWSSLLPAVCGAAGDDWTLADHFQNGRSYCAHIKISNVGHRLGNILSLLSIQSAYDIDLI